jgi:RNA polymerase sigma-70 factor, ECF subfamily
MFAFPHNIASKTMETRRLEQLLLARTDEELVFQAQAGKSAAFDELILRHQDRVFALAYRILGNSDDAADVQQETFVKAWLSLARFRADAAFSTWTHRICVNLCLSRKRKKDWSDRPEELDEDRHYVLAQTSTTCIEKLETSIIVRQALAAIPAKQRTLIVLRDLEGRSFEEIAEIVGGSADSIRTRLSRARKLLREKMRPYLVEEDI